MLPTAAKDTQFGIIPSQSKLSERPIKSGIPHEQKDSKTIGIALHLGPAMILVALTNTLTLSWSAFVAIFLAISIVNLIAVVYLEESRPSVALPERHLNAWIRGLSLVFFKGVLCGGAVVALVWYLLNTASGGPTASHQLLSTSTSLEWPVIFSAVLLTDFAYYWVHRSLNHSKSKTAFFKWFQKKHVTHHSVDVLDFLRGNISSFFDTAVTGFQVPLGIISFILGMDLYSTMIAYALVLMLQATHHANYTFNISYLRFFFMDNHAHKLHHCPRGYLVNHGALFSLWDQVFGTYYENWDLSSNHLQKNRIPLPIKASK